ncbi:protein kinase [Pendulispora rubella]|uniref:Protein kinase n=1 Tax=Pendulispora rubella TaxID=2741070 RepID=A0ABZ2LAR5_9BACT
MTRHDEHEQRARSVDLLEESARLVDDELRQARAQLRPDRRAREGSTFERDDFVAYRYRIVRLVAKGGMGEVYEAHDLELGERIALKVVRQERHEKTRVFEQLKREIFLARKVTHPNVCRIFDVGFHLVARAGGEKRIPFFTMELLQGETLSARLKRVGPLDPREAIGCVLQMIGALGAAHAVGIVHRDFKSANVFLEDAHSTGDTGETADTGQRRRPRVVVTDFGLAKLTLPANTPEFVRTGTGRLRGTPAYMAPEQIECRPVSEATDIYALGVVMYEMLTGVRPFSGDVSLGAAVARLDQPPVPPRTLRKEIDPRLEAIILRCLSRMPADRFASVHDLGVALTSLSRGRRRWSRWSAPALVVCAMAALAAGGIAGRDYLRPIPMAAKSVPSPVGILAEGDGRVRRSLPRLPEAARHYTAGLAAARDLDAISAREHFEHAVALEPGHALSHAELAETYRKLGYGARAAAEAKTAYGLAGPLSREEALLIEGRYDDAIGEWQKAVDVYRTLFEFFPSSVEYGLALARAQERAGKLDEALATVAKLRAVPHAIAPAVDIDEAEAAMAIALSDFRRAEMARLRAATMAEARGAWRSAGQNRYLLAGILAAQGKTEAANEHRREAVAMFERAGDRTSLAAAFLASARECEEEGEFDLALDMYRELQEQHRQAGDMREVALSAYDAFRVLWKQGRLHEALDAVEESVAIGRGIGDPELGGRLIDVADALLNAGDLAGAAAYVQDALDLATRFHNPGLAALAMEVRGDILRQQDDVAGAMRMQKKALDTAQRAGRRSAILWLELDVTELLLDHGTLEAAERAASGLLARTPPHKSLQLASAQLLRARALLGLGHIDRAKAALDRSKDVAPGSRRGDLVLTQRLLDARILAISSPDRIGVALANVEEVIARAHALGFFTMELQARFTAGELERQAGHAERARTRMRELEHDARARGYAYWAKLASAAGRQVG